MQLTSEVGGNKKQPAKILDFVQILHDIMQYLIFSSIECGRRVPIQTIPIVRPYN